MSVDWPSYAESQLNESVWTNVTDWLTTGGVNETMDTSDQGVTTLDFVASLLVGFFLAVLIFLSMAGNLLVCIAVYTDRSLRKVGNLFIVSLAISDLFVACLVMVFAVANDLQGYWVFGDQFCNIWIAFDVMGCTASILNLCAISMDRYIHIKDPLRYGRWMTKRVIYGSIAGIWLLAALISFLPVSMDLHKPAVQRNEDAELYEAKFLDEDDDLPQCALDLTPTYAIVSSCISFYFPCLVMLAIYSRLFFYAKMHVQNIKAVTRPVILLGRFEPDATTNGTTPANQLASAEEGKRNKKKKRRNSPDNGSYHVSDHKAAITLGIIMGVFLICWVPFFCVNIVAAFCKTCIPPWAFKFLTWLGYSNSAFNPIIYSIFNLDFRLAFRKILTSRRCCKDHEDDDFYHHNNHRDGREGLARGSNSTIAGNPNQFQMQPLRGNSCNGRRHSLVAELIAPATGNSGQQLVAEKAV